MLEPLSGMGKWAEEDFPVVLGLLRNSGGSAIFHSLDLLRLSQLRLEKPLTFKSVWAPASFAEAFSPPADPAEQSDSRGKGLEVKRGQQLFCTPRAHGQPGLQRATSLPTPP